MKLFIDTANVEEIRRANDLGVICGVTTNPSLIAREGRDFIEVIREISEIVDGPISAEVVSLEADAMVEENLGYIIYFFEKACAISGYMLGVNPFNQPGVEDYKVNMFALLGKPGYEAHREELLKKIGE